MGMMKSFTKLKKQAQITGQEFEYTLPKNKKKFIYWENYADPRKRNNASKKQCLYPERMKML